LVSGTHLETMTRILFSVWQLQVSLYGAPSLTRGWVYDLLVQLILGLARVVTLGSKVEVEVTLRLTVSQSVSQSVSQYVLVSGIPLGSMTRFYFLLSFAGQLLCSSSWDALSDERIGLWFTYTIASGPCQSSHSRIQIRSRSYFTTDGQSVSQSVSEYVLVSGIPLGPMSRFYFFLSFAGQLLCSSSWDALSDESTGLWADCLENIGALTSHNTKVSCKASRGVNVYMRLFCVYVVVYEGSRFQAGWSPIQGVLPTVYRITKLKNLSGTRNGACRAMDEWMCDVPCFFTVPVYVILGHQDEHLGLMIAMEEMNLFDKGERSPSH
jgi:hypothetical protein